MKSTGVHLIGEDRLIVPEQIEKIFLSPRTRAQQTLDLLLESHKERTKDIPVKVTEDIREWEYGDYEGMVTKDIRALRKSRGLDQDHNWSIWTDGCENGEMPQDIQKRLDKLIEEIVSVHRIAVEEERHSDVLVVAHGHILRCLVLRWINRDINENPALILEAGGVGVLSYEHRNCDEPAVSLGGAFTVPHE